MLGVAAAAQGVSVEDEEMTDATVSVSNALIALVDDAGGPGRLITPRGWRHLGLVIVDSLYSLRANYDTVTKPVLIRYCDSAPGLTWGTVEDPLLSEHTAADLVDFVGPLSLAERHELLNRQICPGTARGGKAGKPKAEAVVEVAQTLLGCGVSSREEFVFKATRDKGQELVQALTEIKGVGIAFWRYMLSLSGVEVSKPDTMILRWLHEVTGQHFSAKEGGPLIDEATWKLQRDGLGVTVRQIDHLVWRKTSGRPLTG